MTQAAPLLRSDDLSRCAQVAHGFTTRHGGVSTGPLASLNLAMRPGETEAALVENWRRVTAGLGRAPSDLVLVSQIHGRDVVEARAPTGPLDTLASADAVVTDVPGLVLAVRTADCVPVLLAAPGAVGAVHAGWRGTAAGVVPEAVRALCALAGCAPADVVAAIGPHISGDAYEVGQEVVAGLLGAGLDLSVFRVPGDRLRVDLGAAVAAQLQGSGVARVDRIGACTLREDRFYSHRRDGEATGRLAAVITRRA